ncbi:MAG: potassium transporter TrkA [Phycisphaeraceae bacterium]|nr:MAG: potassium transporter TrkA [Phycisphaeraceae bacterium]
MAVCAVLALGTAGFMWTEGWTPWHAFYFTVVTISTVGYGDYGLSHNGRVLTVGVMFTGIGTLTYAIGEFIRIAIALGMETERHMLQQIRLIKQHVIVCGMGRIGRVVCEELHEASRPFVVLDSDPERIAEATELGYLAVRGDASDERILEKAGIERAESVVCVANTDAANIVIALTAHHTFPHLTIYARAEHGPSVRKLKRAGATHVVSPTLVSGRRIAQALLRPTAAALLDPDDERDGKIRLAEIHIEGKCPLTGTMIADVGRDHERLVFVAIEHASGDVSPRPDPHAKLTDGDVLLVAGMPEDLVRFIDRATPLSAAA